MKLTLNTDKMMSLALAMLAVYCVAFMPTGALAASGTGGGPPEPTALENVLCHVVGWFTGPIGAGIATLAIIVIGIGALMGKVSWGMAIIVGIGVAVVFGAPSIVDALGATSDCKGV